MAILAGGLNHQTLRLLGNGDFGERTVSPNASPATEKATRPSGLSHQRLRLLKNGDFGWRIMSPNASPVRNRRSGHAD
eukprot:3270675-Amphidinium_carterae.1